MTSSLAQTFLKFALTQQALAFGGFTLKSGRTSPYFFNAGHLTESASSLSQLGHFYATLLRQSAIEVDVLFGPAYKGIPIVSAMGCALADTHPNLGVSFNRKEAKDHGEKGQLVGAPLAGKRVCIVDDVITAGTAIREVIPLIESQGGQVSAIALALDRQEKVDESSEVSAIHQLREELAIPIVTLASFSDLLQLVERDSALQAHLGAVKTYHANYFCG